MWKIISVFIRILIILTNVLIFGIFALNNEKKKKWKNCIATFFIIGILQTFTFLYFDGTLKTIIMCLTNVIFYKYVFNISYSKSILTTVLYMILLMIIESVEIIILTKIVGIDTTYGTTVFANSILSHLIVTILVAVASFLLQKITKRIIEIRLESNIKLVIYGILTLVCILIFFYKAFSSLVISITSIASIFVILVFLVILISLIKQTLNNNKIKEEYDKLLEFMTTYENEIEKQRILRHETKNEFLAIRAKLCDNQKNKEIIGYIDEILKDKIKVKQEAYAKFGYLPANGIKGLCYFKAQVAEEKGIQVSLNISKKIKDSSIYKLSTKEQREFGRILGVILDNAIEASEKSNKKQLGIEAYTTSDKNCKIIISNTFDGEIDKNKIGKERFSTKSKNRGHGLLLVKHIINENRIFELNTDVQNSIYTQIILIKKSIE